MIGSAELHGGLYVIKFSHNNIHDFSAGGLCNSVTHDPTYLWLMRLRHASELSLKTISKQFPYIQFKNNVTPCDACHYAKQRKLPFPNSSTKSFAPFDLLHVDIWGPFSTVSFVGYRYFLTLVDDFSRYTWVVFKRTKDEVRKHLLHFIAYIENQFHTTLKSLRSDNGPEFAMTEFFLSKGIMHQKSCVETPQQNGVVERKHQHILNVARSIFFHSHIPNNMWNFVVQHAIHIINRIPSPLL